MCLEIENVTIMRGEQCTAKGISARFHPGKLYAILGPNGTGKSSLLKALFGEVRIASGRILQGGQPLMPRRLGPWRHSIGYMPQGTELDASLTVLEVVLLGQMDALHMHVSDEQMHKALRLMQRVGIADLAHRDIQSLSGGQRQLALFCQVLLRDPQVLLLDEPVSALDMHHQLSLLNQVYRETRDRNLITIAVLHDLSLAAQFADEVLLLGSGSIQASGTPKEVFDPEVIGRLYDVQVELLHDKSGAPVIRPVRPHYVDQGVLL